MYSLIDWLYPVVHQMEVHLLHATTLPTNMLALCLDMPVI